MRAVIRLLLATCLVLAAAIGARWPAGAIVASPLINPASGKCLDVTGASNADGTAVEIWTCNGGENQSWTSTAAGELRVTIRGVTRCLDATGGGTANGTKIVISSCTGATSQRWSVNADQTITGVPSAKCLDIFANGTANGTIVELWTCKTAADNNQRWASGGGSTTTNLSISGTAGGRVFDGVGAISGGGGNSRLLMDYPEPQRSQVLDYLFRPGFGAAVQLLKIEIGGDANSTDGSEPSVEHVRDVLNCDVGYEFSLAQEAKARNPNIRLYGLAWAAPGWISDGAKTYFHQDTIGYLLNWLNCAKSHSLTIDFLGGRNEKGHDKTWYENLRRALDSAGFGSVRLVANDSVGWSAANDMVADPAFAAAVGMVGVHYPCGYLSAATTCNSTANAIATGKPLWASENGSQDIDTGASALIRGILRGYIDGKMTAYYHWPLVAAITPNLPFSTVGLAIAPSPWSGFYRLGKQTWAIAQVTQFSQPGWRFIDAASGYLGGNRINGSFVTLKSPNGTDYSTVIETAASSAPQTINVTVSNGPSTGTVRVWTTDLNSTNPADQLVRQADLTPSGGRYTITAQPGRIYTLTTTTGQGKGTATSPAQRNLTLPYSDSFDSYPVNAMARYVADMQGSFEVRPCMAGHTGRCLQQVAPVEPILWQGGSDAFTLAGDTAWRDYTVSVDVNLQQTGTVKLIGRANTQARPQSKQASYELRVSDTGAWAVAKRDTAATLTTLVSGTVPALGLNRWHTLSLDLRGTTITATIDGHPVGTTQDSAFPSGQPGLGMIGYQPDQFDNLTITP